MLRTYAEMETFIQGELNDVSTPVQTQLRTLLEVATRKLRAITKMDLSLQAQTITSVASTSAYDLHPRFRALKSLVITVDSVKYTPSYISNREQWDALVGGSSSSTTSDIPEAFALFNGQLHVYPTSATTAQSMALSFYGNAKDLNTADFTDNVAGTATLTNGATTCTGSGTTFLATDAGRYIKSDVEGDWYPIAAFVSTTSLTLGQNYLGTTAGSLSYTIGTIPDFVARYPEAAELLCYFALGGIWRKREGFSAQGGEATKFEFLWKEGVKELRKQSKIKYDNPTLQYLEVGGLRTNPNDYPTGLTT